ncbi:hypothetical protein GBZ26_04375 [Azospirillum formosense]|uniref:Uncharacterized protein n=1 Tax=Azospirillum formosense TaxID=861533 RepID=A0ABX2KPA1_9PROT|nr:hypothetical protein [Azospirillum formosense]MBY3752484.1 hypothetical protein [Azospirillum formosense]NUB18459.1 hypothetical protein [Azospirillum formosense]
MTVVRFPTVFVVPPVEVAGRLINGYGAAKAAPGVDAFGFWEEAFLALPPGLQGRVREATGYAEPLE